MITSKNYVAIPPGETIREQLENRQMSQKEFSTRMGMSTKHINQLINGKTKLEPSVALLLENVLGIPASFWNNLEAIYQEQLARVKTENEMEEELKLVSLFPYSKMANNGWISKTKDKKEKLTNLRRYFEVGRLSALGDLYIPGIAYRKVGESSKSDYALAAWTQKARLVSRNIDAGPINIKKLEKKLSEIRTFTVRDPNEFYPVLREMLLDCGVILVVLPHIGGSFLHGASFVDGKHIILGLTVRGKDADKFWFSLFHELYHIIDGHIYHMTETSDEEEQKADEFSRDTLIDPNDFQDFVLSSNFTKRDIVMFANKVGIHSGIVLGRLQNEGFVEFSKYHELKVQYAIV